MAIRLLAKCPIGKLKPYNKNPRNIEAAIPIVEKSIKAFGFVSPIIVNEDMMICCGHTRFEAAKKAGMTHVPVLVSPDLNDKEKFIAYNIADNQTAAISEWDMPELSDLVIEIGQVDIDLSALGFDDDMLKRLLDGLPDKSSGKTDPDIVPEDVPATCKRGQQWQLGDHSLMCGDCTKQSDVEKLMMGKKARMIVTSPPYENQREYSHWDSYKDYLLFCKTVIDQFAIVRDKNFIVAWNIGSSETTNQFIPADNYKQFLDAKYKWIEWIIWNKEAASWSLPRSLHISKGIYIPAFRWESVVIFLHGKRPHFDLEDKEEIKTWAENVWNMNRVVHSEQKTIGHPSIFPFELPYRLVKSYSKRGDAVYEPLAGSGTTLIACENTKRKCFAMEIEPKYCDVIIKRWEDYTGRKAERVKAKKGPGGK